MKYDLSINQDVEKFTKKCNEALENGLKVEFTKIQQKRTLSQNAYLHVCLGIFAKECGYTIFQLKEILYRELKFMCQNVVNLNGEVEIHTKSSTDLNSKEMTFLIDYIRQRALEMNIHIPTSDEYLQNRIQIDNYLENEY